jgi:hypothetical protein
MKKIKFTHDALYNEETQEQITLYLPSTRIVCPTCNGYGHHFRRDLDENALIREMRQEGDEEGFQMYQSGYFDETCSECKGQKVLDEIDWDYFHSQYPEEAKAVSDWNRELRESEEEREWERRMGA